MASLPPSSAPDDEQPNAGELLFCGSTAWDGIGRKGSDYGGTMLLSPTRLRPLVGVSVSYVACGSASCHCVAVDVEGRLYTWGRNEKGQLGHGDFLNRDGPTIVAALAKYNVVKAGAGRQHTVVITDQGDSLAFGFNKHGQLGSGSIKNEVESLPVKCLVAQTTHVVCGADFSVWLSSTPGASILTAGLPQYGQLGHGTDNEYNAKESSVKIMYEAQPRPRAIAAFTEKTITKVACGNNHTVAADSNGFVYTWGYGGYGRLGHKEQKDEWTPRMVEHFQRNNVLPPTAVVAAGSAYSACTAGGGQLYMWGRVKPTSDNWMYPKPVYDLSGWFIRCMDCGDRTSFVGSEESCISWGQSSYGELGYGPSGPKSSASAKKVDALEGMHVISVACGVGQSLIVVDGTNARDRLDKIDVFEGNAAVQGLAEDLKKTETDKKRKPGGQVYDQSAEENDAVSNAQNGGKKGRGRPKKIKDGADGKRARNADKQNRGKSKKQTTFEDDSDSFDSEDDDKSSLSQGRGKSHSRGRGRGGRGSGTSNQGVAESPVNKKKITTRGRGRG